MTACEPGGSLGAAPLVSIIVPVYNVEPYLRTCIDSILAQTYRELEVILVDDGSPDGCPAICDEYAARDARVRVIHQANAGLSAARNAALDVALGAYIGFVDSDDMIDPDMYRTLVNEAFETGAQVVGCSFYEWDPAAPTPADVPANDGAGDAAARRRGIRGSVERRDLDGRAATLLLLEDDELQNYVWNKLFAACLWRDVRFPVGQKFEDINTTYKLIEAASRVVLVPQPLYYYRMRADGIVKSRQLASEIDCVDANLQRYEALAERYPQARQLMVNAILHAMVKVWPLVWPERVDLSPEVFAKLGHLAAFAREHVAQSNLGEQLGPTGRATMALLPHAAPWAWCASWAIYRLYLARHATW